MSITEQAEGLSLAVANAGAARAAFPQEAMLFLCEDERPELMDLWTNNVINAPQATSAKKMKYLARSLYECGMYGYTPSATMFETFAELYEVYEPKSVIELALHNSLVIPTLHYSLDPG